MDRFVLVFSEEWHFSFHRKSRVRARRDVALPGGRELKYQPPAANRRQFLIRNFFKKDHGNKRKSFIMSDREVDPVGNDNLASPNFKCAYSLKTVKSIQLHEKQPPSEIRQNSICLLPNALMGTNQLIRKNLRW